MTPGAPPSRHETRVRIGSTAVEVTRLGLGTAPIAGLFRAVGDQDAVSTVHHARALGVGYFDTAPLYGAGLAESRLGRGLAGSGPGEATVSTKVGRVLRPGRDEAFEAAFKGSPPLRPVFDFSGEGIRRSYEESLARLGQESTAIVFLHDPDDHGEQALAEAMPALARLRDEGRTGAIGVGMNQVEMLLRFARETKVDCLLVAGRYTLLDQSALRDLLPVCADKGIAVVIGGVFNSGILADPSLGATFDYAPADAEVLRTAERMKDICDGFSVPLAAAALQFPLGHPAVASVLVGARSPAELEADVELFDAPLPPGLWDAFRDSGLIADDVPTP